MTYRYLIFFALADGPVLRLPVSSNRPYAILSSLDTGAGAGPRPAVESDKVFLVRLRMTSVEYLRSKQMLVELDDNQLKLSEENVWEETPAGPDSPASWPAVSRGTCPIAN